MTAPALPPRHSADARRVTIYGFLTAITFYISSGAPTPLYHVYQETMHLTPLTITVIFSVYVFSLMAALLFFGSLSDHLGRRPMILAALVLNIVALIAFVTADGPGILIFARAVQGLATGTAIPALGAAILDTDQHRGPVLNSISAFIGLMVGALLAGLLITFAPAPQQTVYLVLLVVTAVALGMLATIRETAVRKHGGLLLAIRPKLVVPARAVPALLRTSPVNIAGWALGGFYLSLMPTIISIAMGFYSPLIGGAVVAALMLVATVTVLIGRNAHPFTVLRAGTISLIAGVAVTMLGLHWQQVALMFAGTAIVGIGFGGNFSATLKLVMPLADREDRAGLLSAYFVQSYLAFSLPAIAAGLAAPHFGLAATAYGYGAMVVCLALISLIATRNMHRSA